jgi:protein-disulfide isomerase
MPESSTEKKFEFSPSLSILAAGVLIAGSIILVNRFPAPPTQVVAQEQPTISTHVSAPSQNEHIMGSIMAPIVLVEYSDLQCPYCSLIYPTLKKIVDESNGGVAWVYRHFPLESIHPQAKPSALAAECITEQLGNDGFWKFAEIIFTNQTKMAPAYFAQIAAQLGANPTTFASCVSSQKYASNIDAQALEAQQNGGQGTPFTVVVGKSGLQVPFSGAQPYAQIVSVINAVKSRQ